MDGLDGIDGNPGATGATGPQGTAGAAAGRTVEIQVSDPNGIALTVANGLAYFRVPASLHGLRLTAVGAHNTTASSSGNPTVQIRNNTAGVNILTTALTINANTLDSASATTPAVIGPNNGVVTGTEIRIDVTTAGTGTLGLLVDLTFS
jgi:hypothetical protein